MSLSKKKKKRNTLIAILFQNEFFLRGSLNKIELYRIEAKAILH